MGEDSTLLRAVRSLDPQADHDEQTPASDQLLTDIQTRIAAEAEHTRPADVVPRPIPRRTRRILAGAAAAVLIGAGIVTATSQTSPQAYASWTATPTDLRAADVAEMSDLCAAPLPDPDGSSAPELTPVLAEARGDYQMLVSVAEESTFSICFGFPGEDAVREATSLPPEETFAEPAADGAQVISAATWQPLPDHGEVTYAFGSAGADVRGISLSTANDSFAEASVSDGWWVVWFPGEVSFGDTLTVTTADGAVRETTISADIAQH